MNDPKLAVILATDTYATIRPVLERWRRQTVREQIELVLVAPTEEAVSDGLGYRNEFASLKVVVDPVHDLGLARAAGIRTATAPFVFVGETHSFPEPTFAEVLLAAFDGPWSSITPAFGNANPESLVSWAAFLSDYGRWAEGLAARELPEAPVYNAAYQRLILTGLGNKLERALCQDDELWILLRERGHRAYFEPRARIDHANVARAREWIRQRFLTGLLIASRRVRRWSWARRVLYAGGAFLIPAILLSRTLPGAWKMARLGRLPWVAIAVLAAGELIKTAGEFAAYIGFSGDDAERAMHEYELHKLSYVGSVRLDGSNPHDQPVGDTGD